MLNRHGTRLDLGTAEDIAELNAAESLLRTSYKSSTVVGSSSGGGVSGANPGIRGGGYYTRATPSALGHLQASDNDTYGGGVSSIGAGSVGACAFRASPPRTATVATDFSGPVVGGVTRSSVGSTSGTAAASGAAAPPHVNLGYFTGHRSSSLSPAGIAPAPSAASAYAQRVLYADGHARSEEGSPSGRTVGMSSAGATGVVPSSSSGMRAAAPAFYRPQMSMEGAMYRAGTATVCGAEEDKDREGSEEIAEPEPDMERGRSSVHGFFSPPRMVTSHSPTVATAAVDARFTRPQQPYREHGSPYTYHPPHDSVASARAEVMRGGRGGGQGRRGDDKEDSEEAPARPSRVSGRHHFLQTDTP
ncbi:hypothetical protein IOCL2690_000245700 [Leishmania lindenbergi]|uniref:Proteophosphoglycan ppg4 n=1 Tax=Leishmania lindenbergi TaxID=651832 RepID=A0AAW3APS8_9TRYP